MIWVLFISVSRPLCLSARSTLSALRYSFATDTHESSLRFRLRSLSYDPTRRPRRQTYKDLLFERPGFRLRLRLRPDRSLSATTRQARLRPRLQASVFASGFRLRSLSFDPTSRPDKPSRQACSNKICILFGQLAIKVFIYNWKKHEIAAVL